MILPHLVPLPSLPIVKYIDKGFLVVKCNRSQNTTYAILKLSNDPYDVPFLKLQLVIMTMFFCYFFVYMPKSLITSGLGDQNLYTILVIFF